MCGCVRTQTVRTVTDGEHTYFDVGVPRSGRLAWEHARREFNKQPVTVKYIFGIRRRFRRVF